MKERWMGLDYGTKTVGVAISDELGFTAQGLLTVTRKSASKLRQTLAKIKEIADEYDIRRIVVGLPLNMNDTIGERAQAATAFAELVKKRTELPVELWDERLTTVEAEQVLIEAGVRREHRKERIDWMAAALILQGYMDAHEIPDKQ